MKRKSTIEPFSADRLLSDLEHISNSIKAPYSPQAVQEALRVFGENLSNGAIAIRTTNRAGDPLNFWAGEYNRADTISRAVNAGIVSFTHPTVLLLRSWFSMYDNEPEPSTDFDTVYGLAKTWIYFMRLRPVEEVLSAEHVPQSFRDHIDTFKSIGARLVYHVAVNYRSNSVNVYLQIPSEFNPKQATKVVTTLLPDCVPPTAIEMEQMVKCMKPDMPIVFAVTLAYPSGTIERICFYAFMVPKELALSMGIGERLETFLRETPCYDEREVINFGWSFGRTGDRYLKIDTGYCGGFCDILGKLKHN
ncbi:uncharacterized protein LY89DRAFT_339943 [Mollisia scopiformis]|uniref:Aromatic prenyltransferase n=1 Tax=Mollisia scopiformis TaxID=149040 RepID=A0A132B7I1_MOLSC|nr:uncharacterized protein LY89DRAFT_339943 [Mollisia scopiformis]KUJ08301.1 hypothetical protein LY89DRAFT_339943 [Mollisia scopiformis]